MNDDFLFRLEKDMKSFSKKRQADSLKRPQPERDLRKSLKREISRLLKAGLLRPGGLKDDIPVY